MYGWFGFKIFFAFWRSYATPTAMEDISATASYAHEESKAEVRDFFDLLKPRVMSLVVFTAFAGLWIAPGFDQLHPFLAFIAILCIAVGAGAAGAINMWYERDLDALMNRTKNRPIPAGRVISAEALTFGVVLSVASVMLMGVAINWVAGGLLALASLFYVFVYTIWLKRLTPHNIVIGGAAGAFPPMIGWAAVTGSISLESMALFAIIFFWTPPHFWALSLFANEDYKRANIPMLPVVAGTRVTKIQMLVYTFVLSPITLTPYFLGYAGVIYGAVACVLSGIFIVFALRVLRHDDLKYARQMFKYSIFHLFTLFLALIIDKV